MVLWSPLFLQVASRFLRHGGKRVCWQSFIYLHSLPKSWPQSCPYGSLGPSFSLLFRQSNNTCFPENFSGLIYLDMLASVLLPLQDAVRIPLL